jgi:hypothetical protein
LAALHSQDAELVVRDREIWTELDCLFEFAAFGGLIAEPIERKRKVVVQLWIVRIGSQSFAICASSCAGISGGQKLICLRVELAGCGMSITARCECDRFGVLLLREFFLAAFRKQLSELVVYFGR